MSHYHVYKCDKCGAKSQKNVGSVHSGVLNDFDISVTKPGPGPTPNQNNTTRYYLHFCEKCLPSVLKACGVSHGRKAA